MQSQGKGVHVYALTEENKISFKEVERLQSAPLSRIPGGGMPLAAQENHVKDVTKMTRSELLDIKAREAKLLENKSFLNRLKDKGKRVQALYDKVEAELKLRANFEEAAAKFSELNIAVKGEKFINQLEWQGRLNSDGKVDTDPTDDVLDSDDEMEIDPLRIVAQGRMHERRVKVLPPEKTLITKEDIEEIESFKEHNTSNGDDQIATNEHGDQEIEQHVLHLVEKTEVKAQPLRDKFKPYKSTISNVHDPAKEIQRKRDKHWEVTAATPPPLKSCGVKQISLMSSVALQTEYMLQLKKRQEQQAEERLTAKVERLAKRNMKMPSTEELRTKSSFNTYRSMKNTSEIEGSLLGTNEDFEIYDDLDELKSKGTISYVVEDT